MAVDVDREPFAAGVHRSGETALDWRAFREAFKQHFYFLFSCSAECGRDLDVQQARGIAAEDGATFGTAEPPGTFDKSERIYLAHIGGIIGPHQDMVGAVLRDEVFELMVGIDYRVEIEPLQISRGHPVDLLASIRAGRCGVINATRIGRQITAAVRQYEL